MGFRTGMVSLRGKDTGQRAGAPPLSPPVSPESTGQVHEIIGMPCPQQSRAASGGLTVGGEADQPGIQRILPGKKLPWESSMHHHSLLKKWGSCALGPGWEVTLTLSLWQTFAYDEMEPVHQSKERSHLGTVRVLLVFQFMPHLIPSEICGAAATCRAVHLQASSPKEGRAKPRQKHCFS